MVYVCIYMYVCVYVYIYTHTHIHNGIYIHIHTYTMEYYSAIKGLNNAICSRMDESRDYHTKPEKDKYYMISLTCGI